MSEGLIIINHLDIFDDDLECFVTEVNKYKIQVEVKGHKQDEFYNQLEWLLPSAIIVFISKPFLEAIFQEAGKDTYNALKNSIKNLLRNMNKKEISFVSPTGRQVKRRPIGFEIAIEELGVTLKPILPVEEGLDLEAMDKLLDYLKPDNQGELINLVKAFLDNSMFPSPVVYLEYVDLLNDWVCFELRDKAKQLRLSQQDSIAEE